jgi:hypothetical protein
MDLLPPEPVAGLCQKGSRGGDHGANAGACQGATSGRDARRRTDIDRNVSGDAASRPYIAPICLHAVTKLIFSLALGR